jgi:hypothetical protein
MRLNTALTEKEMDVRLLDKHLFDGKLSKKEVEDYFAGLEDVQSNVTYTGEEKVEETPAPEVTESIE